VRELCDVSLPARRLRSRQTGGCRASGAGPIRNQPNLGSKAAESGHAWAIGVTTVILATEPDELPSQLVAVLWRAALFLGLRVAQQRWALDEQISDFCSGMALPYYMSAGNDEAQREAQRGLVKRFELYEAQTGGVDWAAQSQPFRDSVLGEFTHVADALRHRGFQLSEDDEAPQILAASLYDLEKELCEIVMPHLP
jgi:hypothetical protein